MIKLLPCPFCGSKAEIERIGDSRQSTQYQCNSCSCSLETGEEWDHGADWNKRYNAYRLFLDDERMPPDDGNAYVICRSYQDAVYTILTMDMPYYMSLDHDLGTPETGLDFLHWLEKEILFTKKKIKNFHNCEVYVHSQNPIGSKNMVNYIENLRKEYSYDDSDD